MLQYFLPFTAYPYNGKRSDCPVCGSTNHDRISRFDRKLKLLTTHLCGDCGLFFTNPMPSDDELNRYYATTYRAEYQFAFVKPSKTHQNKKIREAERREGRLSEICDLSKPKRYLDFGCGSGELVRRMASLGHQAEGFEQGEDYSAFADQALNEGQDRKSSVHTGSWRDMNFANGAYDVISCLHVLEHLNDPKAALMQVHDWLDDEGIFYIEVPDMQGYSIKGFDCFHYAHVLGFSRDNFFYLLEQCGFALLHEDAPTSLFIVKKGNLLGRDFSYDLAGAAEQNRAEYQRGITPISYLQRHTKRISKMLVRELRQGK